MLQFESGELSPTLAALAEIKRKKAIDLGFAEGFALGYEIGVKQGGEKAKKDFTIRLLGEDFDIAYIAKLTESSVEEVERLKVTLM